MQTTEKLNELLASYQVHYQNLRGVHWNIQGIHFFELHVKFEELYLDAQTRIDEVAERILMLEARPLHSFTSYLQNSKVKEAKDITEARTAVEMLVSDMTTLKTLEEEIISIAESANDTSTVDLMTQLVVFQEKTIWMFKAWLA
jgi:starvation-inducible DNA-binding protein